MTSCPIYASGILSSESEAPGLSLSIMVPSFARFHLRVRIPPPNRDCATFGEPPRGELRGMILLRGWVNRGPLVRLPSSGCRLGAQPQGDMLRLYGAPDHPHQAPAQVVQVRLLAQPGAEGLEGLGSVVLPAVEAPGHAPL